MGDRPIIEGAFRELDDDDSGELDQDEFRSAMRNLGLRLSSAELRQLVNLFDADGDGVVSYREFIDFVEKIRSVDESESKDGGGEPRPRRSGRRSVVDCYADRIKTGGGRRPPRGGGDVASMAWGTAPPSGASPERPAFPTPEVVGALVLLLPLRRRVGPGPVDELQAVDLLEIVDRVAEGLVW